jgi:cyclophilin family peptidyl-prolyl cis-trans isomerase
VSHFGNPTLADSQIYVTLAKRDDLDRKYAVFGHIVSGSDVVDSLQQGDVINRMSVRE